jgi:hypothetical protein
MSKARRRAEKAHSLERKSINEWIPVAELRIDPEGQRKLCKAWVKEKAKNFDPDKMGLIVVNRRSDGSYYVMDGQHRVAVILELGWDDQLVECELYEGLSPQEEALKFLGRNDKRSVQPYDNFRVRLRAKEPIACDIRNIVGGQGLKVSNNGDGAASVSAVVALERIYRGAKISQKDGPKALEDSLKIIIESWGKESSNFAGMLLEGIGLVRLRYGSKIDNSVLVKKLAKMSGGAAGLIGKGRASKDIHGQSIPRNIAAVIVDSYNRNKRSAKVESWWS